ncbi:von Willebrand factor type EGF and pentraxin domain-containing 1, partial [Brachionus plicatilis]
MSTEKNAGINQNSLSTLSSLVIASDNLETTYLESNNIAGYLELMITKLDLNNCLTNCSNNGRCKFGRERQTLVCECFGNFIGSSCHKDKRACSSNPCLNNGTCTNEQGGFRCQCMKEYYFGTNCEKEIDLCANETCSKNGVCVVKENHEILCECFNLYSGEKCEIESRELLIKKNDKEVIEKLFSNVMSTNSTLLFSIEQWELTRRLRNSGLTKDQVCQAFDDLDRMDKEFGSLYNVPASQAVSLSKQNEILNKNIQLLLNSQNSLIAQQQQQFQQLNKGPAGNKASTNSQSSNSSENSNGGGPTSAVTIVNNHFASVIDPEAENKEIEEFR